MNNSPTGYQSIKRDSWPMWLLFIIVGIASGPLAAHFIAMPLIYEYIDIEIPMMVGYIVMAIIGGLSGAFISHFAQEKYQTANNGWPWLLLSLCVPLLLIVATALLIAAIALVVGIIYIFSCDFSDRWSSSSRMLWRLNA